MPYSPEDPSDGAEFESVLERAYARVYDIARETCDDIRQLMDLDDVSPPESDEQKAERVILSIVRHADTDGHGVGVKISIPYKETARKTKSGTVVFYGGMQPRLSARAVRKVFRSLGEDDRRAIASYLIGGGWAETLEKAAEAGDDGAHLAVVEALYDVLERRIVSGDLPVPPLPFRAEEWYDDFRGT